MSDEADLALVGGRVWPGKGRPEATALAARGGRVLTVGDVSAIEARIGPGTRVVELRGRLVVPGFNDAHVHFLDGGRGLLSVDLRAARDANDFVRLLAAHAKTRPPGTWILNGNWDHQAWPGRAEPTRDLIDPVTADHPVLVNRLDAHMALANSRALREAGIDRHTKDVDGGEIERDARGEPTGILKDNAIPLVTRVIPPISREEGQDAVRAGLREAARNGVTTLQDNSAAEALSLYAEARGSLSGTTRPRRSMPGARPARGPGSGTNGSGWARSRSCPTARWGPRPPPSKRPTATGPRRTASSSGRCRSSSVSCRRRTP
jgi:predicted amidohydrolase YtcJ